MIEIIRAEQWPAIRDSLPPAEHLLDPLVPLRGKTLLHGPPSSGKSALAWGLANAASIGSPYLGIPSRRARILFIITDMNKYTLKHRWGIKFVPAFDFICLSPFDCTKAGFLRSQLAVELRKYIAESRIELVIVDALGQIHSGRSAKDDEVADDVNRVLDEWFDGLGVLLIGHDRKMRYGEDGVPEPSAEDFLGSVKWRANATSQLHMWPVDDHVSSLKHAKSQVSLVMEEKIQLYIDIHGQVELYDEHRAEACVSKYLAGLATLPLGLKLREQNALLAKQYTVNTRTIERWRKVAKQLNRLPDTDMKKACRNESMGKD